MVGIERLTDGLSVLINVANATDEALEDNKISLTEGLALVVKLSGLWNTVRNWSELKEEIVDLDDDEKAALADYFKAELDFRDDKLEDLIEKGFKVLLSLSEFLDVYDEVA